MNTNQTNILKKIVDTDKLFENIEKHPELAEIEEELLKEQTEYVSVRDKLAAILGVKPVNVFIRFINKMRTEPNYDPILALSVLTPYLEQDTELLQKVERLVYGNLPEDQGFIQITSSKEIVDNNTAEGSPTFRRRRNT